MHTYLVATGRQAIADYARSHASQLRADVGSEKYYDRTIDIDLDDVEPYVNGPFSPDVATPLSQFANAVRNHAWPDTISVSLIGSCTNASYEDMARAASVARSAKDHGLNRAKSPLTITPGSELTRATIERDGHLHTLTDIGGVVLANACGPCIGNWNRKDVQPGQSNSILSSYNRNFAGRNDGNAATHAFVASPEIVVAMSLAGTLLFNPLTDHLRSDTGHEEFQLDPPSGPSLPRKGFKVTEDVYYRPPGSAAERARVGVAISPTSSRLQLIPPFSAWDGRDVLGMPVLIKTQGKTTTDAISRTYRLCFILFAPLGCRCRDPHYCSTISRRH